VIGDGLVGHVEPRSGVHQKQHDVCFVDGGQGLLCHGGVDTFLVAADAARVDHGIGFVAQHAVTVFTVSGQAGKIRHQRIARAGKAVEQGRFSHIGSTH